MGYLAEELKRVKRITGLSSKVWGELAGISSSTIDQICAGKRSASATVLCQLAGTCGLEGRAEAFICAKAADELLNVTPNHPNISASVATNALDKFVLWGGLRHHDTEKSLEPTMPTITIIEKAVKMGLSTNRISMLPSADNPTQYSMDFVINERDSSE